MAFAWRDYLVVAKSLAEEADEASWRSCVSRAYYAAYGDIAAFVVAKKGGKPPQDAHKWLTETMTSGQGTRWMLLASYMQTFKSDRNKADYHLNKTVQKKEAEKAIADCEAILSEFDELASATSPQPFK